MAWQVVLVRALHQLTAEMAQARAEARQYAAVSERSLSTAWRLGQLGQLGLALLDTDPDDLAHERDDDAAPWRELIDGFDGPPPLTERGLLAPASATVDDLLLNNQGTMPDESDD